MDFHTLYGIAFVWFLAGWGLAKSDLFSTFRSWAGGRSLFWRRKLRCIPCSGVEAGVVWFALIGWAQPGTGELERFLFRMAEFAGAGVLVVFAAAVYGRLDPDPEPDVVPMPATSIDLDALKAGL